MKTPLFCNRLRLVTFEFKKRGIRFDFIDDTVFVNKGNQEIKKN